MIRVSRFLSVAALVLLAPAVAARAADGLLGPLGKPQPDTANLVKGELLADAGPVAAGEKPFTVGVLLTIEPGWHVYWKNPGDAGLATEVRFELPEGLSAGPLRWPDPVQFTQPGDIVSYGYRDRVLLTATLTPTRPLAKGQTLKLRAVVSYLACKEKCIFAELPLELSLPVADEAKSANAELFAEWSEKSLPAAPDFTLTDQAGKPVALSDYRDRVVVLEWINPDCPFVKRHHETRRTMQDLVAKFAPKGVAWLAVNSTYYMDANTTVQWHGRWKLPYPVLIDRSGTVGQEYHAKTTPHMFVIDRGGQIAYAGAIDDDPRGNKDTRVNYVDQALTDLLAGRPVKQATSKPYGCSVKYPPEGGKK